MKIRDAIAARVVAGVCILATRSALAVAQTPSAIKAPVQKGALVTTRANGSFDVKIDPQPADEKMGGAAIGRMSIDKKFHGDLDAVSKGQMLAAMTDVKGSAGYVAIEQVTGSLQGRSGSFVLQHTGTMTHGAPHLSVTVVPDSGTGELIGLTGKMTITITDSKHFYEFDYTLSRPGS